MRTLPLSNFRTLPFPLKEAHKQSVPIHSSPFPPLATTNYFLSLWICLFWIFHIHGITSYVVFCIWLLPLSILSSSFIHVVCTSFLIHVSVLQSFLWLNSNPLYEYATFFYSSIGGHLGCFHFLASMNNAINIHVQVFVWTHASISLGYIPRVTW